MDIDRAIADAEELLVEAGQAKVKANMLDERRKRVRAVLFVKYRGEGKGSAESTEFALADPVYELACADRDSAAMEAETLSARATAKQMRFEAWRSSNATKRAQMSLR